MVEMKEIVKHYGKGDNVTEALKGISLRIENGEFTAITGHSGCGKSTLLNILGGMDRQTKGEYFCDGEDVSGMSERELAKFRNSHIGFVFQAFHLAGELTAAENVALPLGYAGVGAKERKERAKRALANHPRILRADEPTGNLDHENGEKIMALLRELNKEGMTVVMVTHDLELAAMADRCIHMADGSIIAQKN